MKIVLLLFSLSLVLGSCKPHPQILYENGILVLDDARNCTSFDYFIPCDINGTISLGNNLELIQKHIARKVNPGQFQFALLNISWPSSADSFYVRGKEYPRQYLSAVQLALRREDDMSVNTIESINPIHLAGKITITRFYPGQYRITHVRKIVLPE